MQADNLGRRPAHDQTYPVRAVWRVAWYRFRATFGRRLGGYVAIVVLIGLTGGIALGSIAGARRTQSSYPKFLASTNPSDLTVSLFNSYGGTVPELNAEIARLPGVKRVDERVHPASHLRERQRNTRCARDLRPGRSRSRAPTASSSTRIGSESCTGGWRVRTTPNEAVMNASAARQLGVHVGEVMHLGLFASHTSPARLRVNVKLVGIVVFNNQVIQDDIDAAYGFVVLTPALAPRGDRGWLRPRSRP